MFFYIFIDDFNRSLSRMFFPNLKKFRPFLLSPYFLALVITLLIIVILPDIFSRYKSELIRSGFINKSKGFEFWVDIDRDGNSERLILFNNTEGKASVKIMGQNDYIIDQLYFKGRIISHDPALYFSDIEKPGRTRIYIFTVDHDSVFLHCAEPGRESKYIFRDVFITKVSNRDGIYDFNLSNVRFMNLDHDGTRGMMFTINAGFPLVPRAVFLFNFSTQKIQAFNTGCIISITDTSDLDGDGFPEEVATTYSVWNYPDSVNVSYSDHSAWLMVLDKDLHLTFPPLEIRGKHVELKTMVLRQDSKKVLVALLTSRSLPAKVPCLFLFDPRGKMMASRNLGDTLHNRRFDFHIGGISLNRLFLIREGGIIEELNDRLSTIKSFKISGLISPYYVPLNVNGQKILVFTESEQIPPPYSQR